MDDAEMTVSDSVFQILVAVETGKAWLPIVDSLKEVLYSKMVGSS